MKYIQIHANTTLKPFQQLGDFCGNHHMNPMHSGGRTANSTPMKSHDEAKIGQTNLQRDTDKNTKQIYHFPAQ